MSGYSGLKDLLLQYSPQDLSEQNDVQKMLQFLNSHADCFERSCLHGHFTASAFLLNREETKVLLMHHKKHNAWLQLGGHCDGDKDVLAVALKEAREESGIHHILPVSDQIFDVDIHLIPPYKGVPSHYHYDVRFLMKVNSDEDFVKNDESNALQWIDKKVGQLPTDDSSVHRLFQKWRNLH